MHHLTPAPLVSYALLRHLQEVTPRTTVHDQPFHRIGMQMYKLGTNLNNSFFATRDTRKVGDYDFLRVQSLETTISPEVLHQPHFSRCTAVFQCLRNHNYVRFFRILKDAPVLVAAMLYSLYGQHMRITGLSLISKLSPKEISLEQITRYDVESHGMMLSRILYGQQSCSFQC